jgi:uncharacterized protein
LAWFDRLVPDAVVDSVLDVTPAWLQSRGIRGLILDLDNTLVPYGQYDPAPEVLTHLRELAAAGIPAMILSNAMSARTVTVARHFSLPFLANAGKPAPQAFHRALGELSLTESEVAVVGDQIFRDVLGARRAGCFAVLVKPLSPRDFVGTRLLRWPESWVIRHLRRRGIWPR